MSERAKFKGVVNLIIKQDDKFLLFFRNDGFFNYDGGWWVIPAGHIEAGETAMDAAIREAKEELDIDVLPSDIEFANVISNLASREESFEFCFIINKFSGAIRNCEGDKCAEMRFVSPSELKDLKNIVSTTKLTLDGIINNIKYSECRKYESKIKTWSFNNDELFNLVKDGRKRATCSLYKSGDKAPNVGEISIIKNSKGDTITIKLTNVSIRKFSDIDTDWAKLEGEGDLSLKYWQNVHREFFGIKDENPNLLCEEFIVLK